MTTNYLQYFELMHIHRRIHSACFSQKAYILALFLLLSLALVSKSFANNLNHTVFKTPADASVSFQVLQGKSTRIICSGVRISNFELITSISCLKKLENIKARTVKFMPYQVWARIMEIFDLYPGKNQKRER